ncbi:phosphotransferase [Amycolatopsis japonica]
MAAAYRRRALDRQAVSRGQVRAERRFHGDRARLEHLGFDHADQRELALLAGGQLLHTDLNPHNILITTSGAKIVDWAWPTLGAAWVDPACAALWLIAEGHSPAAAKNWAAAIPAWREAPATGIDIFTTVNRNLWKQIADNDPQPWKGKLHQAAQAWNEYRLGVHRPDS